MSEIIVLLFQETKLKVYIPIFIQNHKAKLFSMYACMFVQKLYQKYPSLHDILTVLLYAGS